MSRRPRVGWYVHHQGAGHTTRFLAISRVLDADIVVFSSAPRPRSLDPRVEWVVLARDDTVESGAAGDTAGGTAGGTAAGDAAEGAAGGRPEVDARQNDLSRRRPDAGGLLHWAPLGHRGHASRLACIAARIAEQPFDAFVVDVSVEVTLFVRLLGVPVIMIAQPGDRTDRPHGIALAAADAVIAPWPESLYKPAWLEPVTNRVHFVGGISRFDGRPRSATRQSDEVVLLAGAGGSAVSASDISAAVEATPDSVWRVLGLGWNSAGATWIDDPFDVLSSAGVVVSWAGQNAVADLAASRARAIVIAQPRSFGEQEATAEALSSAALAVTLTSWPKAGRWPELLRRARETQPRWSLWRGEGAADRAAAVITSVASA